MKRLVGLFLIAAFVMALSMSHSLLAKGPPENGKKVYICHITEEGQNSNGEEAYLGHIVNISKNALPDHCAHGDHEIPNLNGRGPGDSCGRTVDLVLSCGDEDSIPPVFDDDDDD